LVGSQLGQTLRTGGLQRPVLLASIGSAALLGIIVQTPGLSHVFGCRPLGPFGWGIAIGSATASTLAGAAVDRAAQAATTWLTTRDDPEARAHERVDTQTLRPGTYSFAALDPAMRLLDN
jgi:cation-transporting ATPase I